QAGAFLHRHLAADLAILDRLQVLRGDLAVLEILPRLLQFRRAQQAADLVGAKGGSRSVSHGMGAYSGKLPLTTSLPLSPVRETAVGKPGAALPHHRLHVVAPVLADAAALGV